MQIHNRQVRTAMNSKILTIIVVAVVVAAGAGAAIFLLGGNNGNDDKKDSILTHRLLVMGNVYSDDTLDNDDVKVLEALVNGDSSITVNGNEIDLTEASLKKYADVNNDAKIDSEDVNVLKTIIAGNAATLFYENANGEIRGVDVPINNLLVMFRRVGTTVAMVGASDMVKGFIKDLATGGNYGFLNFTGTNLGNASEPDYEKILQMNEEYASTGGVTLIADATGADANLENHIDAKRVVRMPVTEMGKSENGVVTLGYLLAYKNDKHDQILGKLNQWISWNDSAKQKIDNAVKNLPDSDKKTCIVCMYNASGSPPTINVRGAGVSEYEYSVYCGGKNIGVNNSLAPSDLNEYLLTENPEYCFIMQQEVYLLKNKVSAQTTYEDLMTYVSDNYHGKVGVFSQFFGTGPGYVLSLMYYASVLIPELANAFDITEEYKYFMGTLVGNQDLKDITAFVPIS